MYWCIMTELSFLRNFWKDDDLSLYVRLRQWNIQTNEQYSNCNSLKAFITIYFLSTVMKGVRRARTLSVWHAFYRDYWHGHQILSLCQLLFLEVYLVFDSMEERLVSAVLWFLWSNKQRDYEVQIRCSMSETKYGECERDVLWSLKWTRWKWMTKWMSWTLTHEMIRWTLVYEMKVAGQICNIPLLKYVKNEK